MTTNFAVIEQGANETLSENRRELAEESAKIKREPDLSEEARSRYIGEARERAQATDIEIIDGHDKAIRDRLEQNEKSLLSLFYPKDALTESQKERFRVSYRQAALQLLGASEETVSRALSRAYRTGETVLEQAAYHESIERGLSEVGDASHERHPRAREVWATYVRDRRAAESREHILAGALQKTQDA